MGARRTKINWWRSAAAAAAIVAAGAFTYGIVVQMQLNDERDDNAMLSSNATAQARELSAAKTQVVVLTRNEDNLEERLATTSAVLDVTLQPDAEWTALEGTAIAPRTNPAATMTTTIRRSHRPRRRSSARASSSSGASPPVMYGPGRPFSRARLARGES